MHQDTRELPPSRQPPIVSVLMLTHNHGLYLQEAIASVQAQTLQIWELLIGEDASSDTTGAIAREAALRDCRIQVFSSPGGALGFHHNFSRLLSAARAPYVAFLEGDDWWHESRKLEWQVAMLQADPSLAFCGGCTRVLDQRPNPGPHTGQIGPALGNDRLALPDLIQSYSFHFSSVLMCRQAVELPSWIFSQYCLDRPLYLLAARMGDAGVIHAELSTYRLHGGGVWAPLTPLQRARRSRQLFGAFCTHFPHHYRRLFRLTLSHILWFYLSEALIQRKRWQALLISFMGVEAAPVLRLVRQPKLTIGSMLQALSFHSIRN